MKKIIVLALALSGCAGLLSNHIPYDGPPGIKPMMSFSERVYLAPDGMSLVKDVQIVVVNPNTYPVKTDINCDDLTTFYVGVVLPPRTTSYYDTSRQSRKCWLANRKTLVP